MLARPRSQPPLVVALADGHAARAQDVVGGDRVEMKVGEREREDEGLGGEGESPRSDSDYGAIAQFSSLNVAFPSQVLSFTESVAVGQSRSAQMRPAATPICCGVVV